jgi:hypothetical protein
MDKGAEVYAAGRELLHYGAADPSCGSGDEDHTPSAVLKNGKGSGEGKW